MVTDYFPFEKYLYSCNQKDYSKDIRKRSHILKYINLLVVDDMDKVSLRRLVQNMIFFRNVFTKDAFLEFFIEFCKPEEQIILSKIVYDVFVVSNKGDIGEYGEFYAYSLKVLESVQYDLGINENWKDLKEELGDSI